MDIINRYFNKRLILHENDIEALRIKNLISNKQLCSSDNLKLDNFTFKQNPYQAGELININETIKSDSGNNNKTEFITEKYLKVTPKNCLKGLDFEIKFSFESECFIYHKNGSVRAKLIGAEHTIPLSIRVVDYLDVRFDNEDINLELDVYPYFK